jgi:imidazole glycerol-phosphate synthase subunit HisH
MIAIIDYGMGNLRSVEKGIERVGGTPLITNDPRQIARADQVILPGVGAFRDAIRGLQQRDLVEPIRDAIEAGTPFLGICLGLQLLFDVSYEGGEYEGLGIIPGRVVRFEDHDLKVPHMGWNEVEFVQPCRLADRLPPQTHFYFVHSYYVVPEQSQVITAETHYGTRFCAMIQRGNLFATQFHPEKSQAAGMRFLQSFVSLDVAIR